MSLFRIQETVCEEMDVATVAVFTVPSLGTFARCGVYKLPILTRCSQRCTDRTLIMRDSPVETPGGSVPSRGAIPTTRMSDGGTVTYQSVVSS